MRALLPTLLVVLASLFLAAPAPARADPTAPPLAHGPLAPDTQFPSHVFQLAAHEPQRVQLAFHYGLSQPILAHGFNAAVDVRYRRLILTYSHGQGLDYALGRTDAERAAGMQLLLPVTTGGGIGVLLLDELWVLGDVKLHHFDVSLGTEHASYDVVTVGAEIGWRFFVWKGFNIGLVGRYWPNVWSSAQSGIVFHDASGHELVHHPAQQGTSGFLANALIGWAFDL